MDCIICHDGNSFQRTKRALEKEKEGTLEKGNLENKGQNRTSASISFFPLYFPLTNSEQSAMCYILIASATQLICNRCKCIIPVLINVQPRNDTSMCEVGQGLMGNKYGSHHFTQKVMLYTVRPSDPFYLKDYFQPAPQVSHCLLCHCKISLSHVNMCYLAAITKIAKPNTLIGQIKILGEKFQEGKNKILNKIKSGALEIYHQKSNP